MKKIIALIPARGGSKGIPRKNIIPVCGKPLIAYSIEAAIASKSFDRVIVSTDDTEIAEVSKKFGAEIPFMRPDAASDDIAPAIAVLVHALEWLKTNEGFKPDAVAYLQPTSPLRTAKHLEEAVKLFQNNPEADTLVSVVEPPHNFNPIKLMKEENNYLVPFMEGQGTTVLTKNDLPKVLARNGPAILICSSKVILEKKQLYGEKTLPYLMQMDESVDIDYPQDLDLAEFYLGRR
jgi:CMP-N,N'-diacetyllegionaminic acid synthase